MVVVAQSVQHHRKSNPVLPASLPLTAVLSKVPRGSGRVRRHSQTNNQLISWWSPAGISVTVFVRKSSSAQMAPVIQPIYSRFTSSIGSTVAQ